MTDFCGSVSPEYPGYPFTGHLNDFLRLPLSPCRWLNQHPFSSTPRQVAGLPALFFSADVTYFARLAQSFRSLDFLRVLVLSPICVVLFDLSTVRFESLSCYRLTALPDATRVTRKRFDKWTTRTLCYTPRVSRRFVLGTAKQEALTTGTRPQYTC